VVKGGSGKGTVINLSQEKPEVQKVAVGNGRLERLTI